ncbi:DUF4260 domain-containing protein [Sphingobacterium sp. LRF_L2]|uniref:DUF4260 domain-containing protein n=1 Tax=Sphingobacterium sp. LRF_L2 TaxID=3369421 RepID=UPI003F639991
MEKERGMRLSLRIEEISFTVASLYGLAIYNLGLPFWSLVLLFFTPDISMLGYLVNPKIGAYVYNLFHHRAIAVGLISLGYFAQFDVLIFAGIVVFGHASFDRIFGYGLKFSDDFRHTSLGWIGKNKAK